jgi:hypothetical protein
MVSISPPPTASVNNSNIILPPGQYYDRQIPIASEEYNHILETYLYGRWVITKVIIEPAETMSVEGQAVIIGSILEYEKSKATNDFTKDKKESAYQHLNPTLQDHETETTILEPRYVIEDINLLQYLGGGSYYTHSSAGLEFNDMYSIITINVFANDNHIWRSMGGQIAIRNENTLVLAFADGYWEMKRIEE